ncbi:reverse transcriptase [Tanacetum coccineum]
MELPSCNKEGMLEPEPIDLLDRKMVKRNNAAVVYGLIQWANRSKEDATWELLEELYAKFPNILEDKNVFKGNGMISLLECGT